MNGHGPLPAFDAIDESYWAAAREGRLSLQRCDACAHIAFPPARRCHVCGHPGLNWIDLSGRARVWSWVTFHRTYYPEMPAPYTVLRVALDEGPQITVNLVDGEGGADLAMLAVDARVRIVFRPAGTMMLPQALLLSPIEGIV